MEKKKYLVLLLILINSMLAAGSMIIDQPIEKYVKQSALIVMGKVIDKESKHESFHLNGYSMSNGKPSIKRQKVDSIYTTFTIQIDEVLYGKYEGKSIAVKMLGGCADKGPCFRMSSQYDYAVNEDVLIFLSYDEFNDFFQSTSDGITAYTILGNDVLVRANEAMSYDNNSSIILPNEHGHLLSVDELKRVINDNKKQRRD